MFKPLSDTKHHPPPPPPPSIDFSDDETTTNHHPDMIIEISPPNPNPNTNQNPNLNPNRHKKRAETWVQDETRTLISLRREMDSLFNTSKSNKHLWDQISSRMRDRGFDRSPTMCTDKWRNLLKEFKKVKHHQSGSNPNGCPKMSYYKEIDEILRDRTRNNVNVNVNVDVGADLDHHHHHHHHHSSKVDSFLHFSDKGIDDTSIQFGPIEANERTTLNLENRLDHEHEGLPLAITAADAVTGSEVPPSFWRETPGNGDETHSFGGRVIMVRWGDYSRRVGVDGTADAIKDVIRSAFGLRTKRAFWLEDEDQIIRSLDREMPLGAYILHLDEGVTIKLCHYEESDHIPYPSQTISHTEEKTFYTEEDFREFMHRRGWSCLRELNGYRNIDNLDDLRPDTLYRGVT